MDMPITIKTKPIFIVIQLFLLYKIIREFKIFPRNELIRVASRAFKEKDWRKNLCKTEK
jgi:hypothetical protein